MDEVMSFFTLENYERFREMPLMGWHRELDIRARLLAVQNSGPLRNYLKKENLIDEAELYISQTIEKIKVGFKFAEEPNYRGSLFLVNGNDFVNLHLINKIGESSYSSVYPLSYQQDRNKVENEKLEKIKRTVNWAKDKLRKESHVSFTLPLGIELEDYFKESNREAHLIVDLNSSDEQILSDFKYMLETYRDQYKKMYSKLYLKKSFSSNEIKKWFRFGVIPFIDLKLLERYERIHITNHQIGNLIYSNEDGIDFTERVRKVTKPLASCLLTEHTLSAMYNQALKEME